MSLHLKYILIHYTSRVSWRSDYGLWLRIVRSWVWVLAAMVWCCVLGQDISLVCALACLNPGVNGYPFPCQRQVLIFVHPAYCRHLPVWQQLRNQQVQGHQQDLENVVRLQGTEGSFNHTNHSGPSWVRTPAHAPFTCIHMCPSTNKQHISLTDYPDCHYKVTLRLLYVCLLGHHGRL